MARAIRVLRHAPRVRQTIDDAQPTSAEFGGFGMSRRDLPRPAVCDFDPDVSHGLLDRHGEVRVRVAHAVRRKLGDHEGHGLYDVARQAGECVSDISPCRCGSVGSIPNEGTVTTTQYLEGFPDMRPGNRQRTHIGRGARSDFLSSYFARSEVCR